MQITDNEKLGASTLPRSSSSLGVPIKKRPILFTHSPSPPPSPPRQSSLPEDAVCDENTTSWIPVHFKDDLATEGKKDPILNSAKLQVKAITGDVGRNHAKFSNLDNKCTPQLIMESAPLVQALKETSVPIANGEGQLVRSDTSAFCRLSTTELQLETKGSTEVPMDGQGSERKCIGQLKLGSASLDITSILDQQKDNVATINSEVDVTCDNKNIARLNWDLNTPMEAWENAVNDFSDLKAVEQVQGEQDGIPKGNLQASYAQLQLRERSETDYIACGKDLPLNGERESTSTPISATRQENLGSKALLDLQLKPSYDGKHTMEMRSQTVSVDLRTHIGSSVLETSRVVKDEPYENGNQQGCCSSEMVKLNLVLPQVVKPEPLEGSTSESCKTIYCGFEVSPSRIIKSEPMEGFCNEHRRWSSITELNNQKLVSNEIEKSQDVSQCVDKALDLITECAKVNRPQNGTRISDEPMTSGIDIKVLHDRNELPTGSGISQEMTEPIGNPLKGISKSQNMEVKDLNLNNGAQQVAGGVPSEDVLSVEKQHLMSCSLSEFDAVRESSEKKILSASEVEPPFEHSLSLGALGNVGVDTGSDMDISDDDMPVGNLDTADAAVKLRYTVHKDLDGEEARNPAPDSRFGGVSHENHGINVGVYIPSVDAPMLLLKHPDEDVAAAGVVKSSNGVTTHHGDSSVDAKNPSICKVASESSDTLEHADKSVKKENMHGTDRLQQDHVKNDKGPAAKSKFSQAPGTDKVQLTDLSSKLESAKHSDAMEQSNFRSKDRRFLTSDKVSQFGKLKYIPGRFLASKSAKEKAIDSSNRRDKPVSRGSRDEIFNERPRRFENDRYLYEAAAKGGEYVGHHRRRGDENIDASHGDRAHGLGQGSTSFRFRRSKDVSELSIESDGFTGSGGRNFRKPMNDDLQCIPPRAPFRRHSPGGRAKIPADVTTVRHQIGNDSPVRGLGRISHDFFPFNHDDKLLRILPDEIMDHHLLSHPFTPYEQEEYAFIRRGRRSMSPPAQRRGSHMHRFYLDSYRRSPSEFDGHADIIRCRSPQLIRHDRMRSPPRDPYIRFGSPSYVDRLPDEIEVGYPREHMMELVPSREHDGPRPGRGPDRSIRRFDMVDPRVIEEEESFRPSFHEEIHEISEDECIDGRINFGGRGGHVRSVRQRLGPRNDGDNFVFENGPHRPSRFGSDGSEEFCERTQDYSRTFRNRLGNMHCRSGGILDHEDNLIRHEEQGRRDVPPSDLRLKRRRF